MLPFADWPNAKVCTISCNNEKICLKKIPYHHLYQSRHILDIGKTKSILMQTIPYHTQSILANVTRSLKIAIPEQISLITPRMIEDVSVGFSMI